MDSDWTAIANLADLAVNHVEAAPPQQAWVENRRRFQGQRRHYVLDRGGKVAGYGSIEETPADSPGTYRMFLVLCWTEVAAEAIADALLARLRIDMAQMDPAGVFFREYADDRPLIEFLLARGFQVARSYEYDGLQLVNLTDAGLPRDPR